MKISCVALDDEPRALDIIRNHVSRIDFLRLEECFTDPFKALSYLEKNDIDLLFLDIQMPDITGTEIVRSLRKKPLVVFTTAFSEYAIESYELEAVDYLLKPFDFNRFFKAVTRVREHLVNSKAPQEAYLFLNEGTAKRKVNIHEIFYIQAEGNYVRYVTEDGSVMVRSSITETAKLLESRDFVQIHRSTIISIRWVDKIENNHVHIQGNKLQISDTYRASLFQKINIDQRH